jgi:hypothetical protein
MLLRTSVKEAGNEKQGRSRRRQRLGHGFGPWLVSLTAKLYAIAFTIGNTQRIIHCSSPFKFLLLGSDKNDRRKASMTRNMERPYIWNDRTYGTTVMTNDQ